MRRDVLYIADLVDNARVVHEYLDGVTRERWEADRVLRDAVLAEAYGLTPAKPDSEDMP